MARALINVPATAERGAVIELKALIAHPMETGYRPGPNGQVLPRDIIRRFTCAYNGEVVFGADLHPAMTANPFLHFTTIATESGTIAFTWQGDNSFAQTETASITVT
jgi:sulfur-oxidizing protein SoxZ